jgi:hypothetical protein
VFKTSMHSIRTQQEWSSAISLSHAFAS